jgi:hypothetical protein
MKTNRNLLYILLMLLLSCWAAAEEDEAYTRVLDRLTAVQHFSDRPILFIIGFDTSKSMSVEFDRSKKLTQTILSRYGAPGDSVYVFGFADKPSVLPATTAPKILPEADPDKEIASINESLLSLPRSSAKGTVFGRAKLFALEKAQDYGKDQNTMVLLFSDNNSEIDMGTDERKRLKTLESKVASNAETIPLYSQGVSPLWLTLYTNSFPNPTALAGPDGKKDLDNPRLAWAARRVGSQTLEFIAPAGNRLETGEFDIVVQFLGSAEPKSAVLSLDGSDQKETKFKNGRASWSVGGIEPGSHVLFVQAILADGKVRTAEKQVTIAPAQPVQATPTPKPKPDKTPKPKPKPKPKKGGSFPIIPLLVLLVLGAGIYFFSLKPVKIRVIGPDSEETFMLAKGKSLRVGGKPRVESDLVFPADGFNETIVSVRCLPFAKAKVFINSGLRQGSVEAETDEGFTVGDTGEPLITSVTVTYADERGRKQVFTLVKEDASGPNAEEAEYFGSGEEASDDGGDWRS